MNDQPVPQAPPQTIPTQLEFSEAYARQMCDLALKIANEPARVSEHNRLAGRILTPKGITPMQRIDPVDLLIGMVSALARVNAAILNELLIQRTGNPGLKAKIEGQPTIQAGDNGKPHGL